MEAAPGPEVGPGSRGPQGSGRSGDGRGQALQLLRGGFQGGDEVMGLGLEAGGLMEDRPVGKAGALGSFRKTGQGWRGRGRAGAADKAAGGLWALSASAHIRSVPAGCCLESLGL